MTKLKKRVVPEAKRWYNLNVIIQGSLPRIKWNKEGAFLAKYDAVLFDVDGTLLHSSPGILACMAETFRQAGIDPKTIDLTRYLGPPLRQSFSEHVSDETMIERMVEIYRAEYRRTGQHLCSPYSGVKEMLEKLKDAGIELYTATAKPTVVVTPILEEQGLAGYFRFIGGASEDASAETKTAVIRSVLARPELEGKRVLMVGDRKDDMQGAADCKLPAAGVLYGYGSQEELAPFAPVFLAQSCDQLTRYIMEL